MNGIAGMGMSKQLKVRMYKAVHEPMGKWWLGQGSLWWRKWLVW